MHGKPMGGTMMISRGKAYAAKWGLGVDNVLCNRFRALHREAWVGCRGIPLLGGSPHTNIEETFSIAKDEKDR